MTHLESHPTPVPGRPRLLTAHVPGGRRIRIHLPRGYHRAPARRFPVVYVLDGQNVFLPEESFAGVAWGLDAAADHLEDRGAAPAILVAVDHAGAARGEEYAPFAEGPDATPGAADHLAFLLAEVHPRVAAWFRVADTRPALLGAGLAGLFALWAAIEHPAAFGRVAALSPEVEFGGEAILRTHLGPGPRPAVWVDMGGHEGPTGRWQLAAIRGKLQHLGWTWGRDLAAWWFADAGHDEASWGRRAGAVLGFLVGEGEVAQGADLPRAA